MHTDCYYDELWIAVYWQPSGAEEQIWKGILTFNLASSRNSQCD